MSNLPPISSPRGAPAPLPSNPHDDILAVAKAQRWVLLGVLANISTFLIALVLGSIVANSAGSPGIGSVVALFNLVRILIAVVVAVATWNLGRALQLKLAWLLALLSLVPLLGLIVLLSLNSRATKRLQAAGYRVGLLGAKTN